MATQAAPAAPAAAPVQSAPAPAVAPAPVTQTIVRVVEAPPVVEQAPAEPKVSSWEAIKAKAGLPADVPEIASTQEPERGTASWDTWDTKRKAALEPEKPAISNAKERIEARRKREEEARNAASLQQQLQERDYRLSQLTQEQQNQRAQFGELIKRGDADAAMKVLGTGMSFEEMTRQVLIAKGGLPAQATDPKLEALIQEREAERKYYLEQQQRQQQAQLQQQRRQEYEVDALTVQQEIASMTELPEAEAFSKIPNVNYAVLDMVIRGEDIEVATQKVYDQYQQLYDSMTPHFGKRGGAQQTAASAPPPASVAPLTRVARPTTPATKLPENLWGESRWEAIKRERGIQ